MAVSRRSRRRALAICCILLAAQGARAEDFQWNPGAGSNWQWTNPQNWLSVPGGAPSVGDTAVFTRLSEMPESPIARGDPDPQNLPPLLQMLSIGAIEARGYYSYDETNLGLADWRIELSRIFVDENDPPVSTAFTLDLDNGNGLVRVGHFEEPVQIGDPAVAQPGGLTITGRTTVGNVTYSAPAGFRGTVDVRHGRLTLQDLNYDDHDALSTFGGIVDSRDDLSYIPQRLPNAELTIEHSHFDSFKTRGLAIGTVGRANALITSGSALSNLQFLRVGGDSSQNIASHEQSNLTLIDSAMTVGAAVGGGVYVGDMAASDLIDPYNGTLTLTRSSIGPSIIRDNTGTPIGEEALDIHVGHYGFGKALIEDASSMTARRLFVGEKLFSFGELRLNSSQINLHSPEAETIDHAGRFTVGAAGLGFVVVTGSAAAPSSVSARSLNLGENQNAYGDAYFDRNSSLTLADSASVGIRGQGRLTVTGRFDSANPTLGRNVYFSSTATVGTRPVPISGDPSRTYTLTAGGVWASAGFLVVGEGARLDVTDQPLAGADDVDEFGVELWRTTGHRLTIGDDGLGWLTVHADGLARAEWLTVGQASLGVGHVVLDKALLNSSAANLDYAVPGTLRVSRGASIGSSGQGTLDIRGPYVPFTGGTEPDSFDQFGLLTASLTLGDNHGSSGTAHVTQGGQLVVNGTLEGERDLKVARHGSGFLDVSDPIVLSGTSSPQNYVSGASGGVVRVLTGNMLIGGADPAQHSAAKGIVTVNPNGLVVAQSIELGSALSNGDSLSIRGPVTAYVNSGSELRTFAGGTLRATHIAVRGDSTLAIETAPVASADPLRDGSVVVSGGVDVYGGTLRLGTVERSQAGWLTANVTLHGGQLKGNGTIEGNLLSEGGDVSVQVNGPTPMTEFDSIHLTGTATFNSGGIVVANGSFVGQVGQRFDIFTFVSGSGSRTTSFDVLNPLAVQPGAQWISYLDADSYTLAVAGATGDVNCDGAVDFDDLLTLAQNYGASGVQNWTTGDFNDDQTVNFDDLLFLAQNYGSHLLSEANMDGDVNMLGHSFSSDWLLAQSLAPEPAIASLLLPFGAARRRRSSRC